MQQNKKYRILQITVSAMFLLCLTYLNAKEINPSINPKTNNQFRTNENALYYSLNADTSSYGNKISKVWNNGQNMFIIKLNIVGFKDRIIKLSLVNLIGKEVKIIYEGMPKDSDWEYSFTYPEIPSGVYICVLSSADYRDAKKIVISK